MKKILLVLLLIFCGAVRAESVELLGDSRNVLIDPVKEIRIQNTATRLLEPISKLLRLLIRR